MDKETMVDKLKNLIKQIERQKGPISLFMLWKDVQDISKWSVVISAPWLDNMGQREAVDYWIKHLQLTLNNTELTEIIRVSVIKTTDNFVTFLTRALNITDGAVRFTRSQVGNYYINDAIIFEAKGLLTSNTPFVSRSRNPIINRTINPNLNRTINPNLNRTINPNLNRTINPNLNRTINPNLNRTINPNLNRTINPNLNRTINPNLNRTINPNLNRTINPNLNPNFSGLILYDLSLRRTAYFIKANDSILSMFDFTNNYIGFCVKAVQDFYNVFDASNKWVGYLISNKQQSYNYFSLDNNWIGFIV